MPGKPPSGEYKILHEIADRLAPILEASLITGITAFKGRVDLNLLKEALLAGDIHAAERAVPWQLFSKDMLDMQEPLKKAVAESGAASRQFFQASIAKLIPTIDSPRIPFDADSLRLVGKIQGRALEITQGITAQSQDAIRDLVIRSVDERIPVSEASRFIRDSGIGLNNRQATALGSFRSNLVENGLPASRVRSMVAGYGARLLKQRSRTIARTEMITAVNAGQQEVWDQAADAGLYDREKAFKVWIVTPDDRLCELCRPMSHPVIGVSKVPVKDPFFNPPTGMHVQYPTLHPNCRCSMTIDLQGAIG